MKLLLKSFLILCLVCAGIYAASPFWLSRILASQLPPGWQLEDLKSGYPGLTGIDVDLLRVKGVLGPVGMALTSSDLHFTYKGLKTDIDQLVVDVFMGAPEIGTSDMLTLDDLSLPVTKLTGKLPQLSIGQIRVKVHRESGLPDVNSRPLLLDFDSFSLSPHADKSFQLASQVLIAESLRFKGRLEVDVSPQLINAAIRFPSSTGSSPWLVVKMKQEDLSSKTVTRLDAALNAELANREWLDSVLAGFSGRLFSQLGGKLEIHADFAGQDQQKIERLSLTTENLRLVSDQGTLDLSAAVTANRDGENISVTLPTPATLDFQGDTSRIDELLKHAVPELKLTPRTEAKIQTVLGPNSHFMFLTVGHPFVSFNGDVDIRLQSSTQNLTLQSSGLQVQMADPKAVESITAEGLVALDLKVSSPVSFATDDLQIEADGLSVTTNLTIRDGAYFSNGAGTLERARITPDDIYAEKIELDWKELNLTSLTGNLDMRTQGFSSEIANETFTGFDFDIKYTLLSETNSSGTGIMNFDAGTKVPFEFSGDTELQRWNIKLPPVSIRIARLKTLLSVAHFELPASVKLTDGSVELQGDILVNDEITANLRIKAYDAGASMSKSSARKANFTLRTTYDKTLKAIGPVSVELVNLAGGIDVANIKTGLEFEDVENFELSDVYAEVFDGQVQLGKLQYSNQKIAETTTELRHINLAKLLAYADIDGLEGTGYLDISLPLGSDQTGVYVSNGTFHSTVPGRLAYTKEGVAGSNIGLQALENFQYKDLSGTLNYHSDGNYVITIRLEGKNPDLYGGHPVVFNLNINGLLPELFEAMFMTGSFEESILKQIKSR